MAAKGGGGGGDLVGGRKVSTVVPASVTGDIARRLSAADLAMKLHYLKAVYYFGPSEELAGLGIQELKKPMFPWLDAYSPLAGRVRRPAAGAGGDGEAAAFVKCNDCGVRIVEARCGLTLEKWVEIDGPWAGPLVPDKALGPDLDFSPLVYVQFTKFKCGGMAVGLSWSHLIGDAFAAAACFNDWARLLNGNDLRKPLAAADKEEAPTDTRASAATPLSVKVLADGVGSHWIAPCKRPMTTFNVKITPAKYSGDVGGFEAVCAVLWQRVAKIRAGGASVVTVCRGGASPATYGGGALRNAMRIGYVKAEDASPEKTEIAELAEMLAKNWVDETDAVERAAGERDVVVYGANLTFVDMVDVELHGLEIKGRRPEKVVCSVAGVGEEGAAVVYREAGNAGLVMTAVVTEEEADQLRAAVAAALGDA